jgi:murein DD-endopeptidase MepM/ murein hydrolase activator NlpD
MILTVIPITLNPVPVNSDVLSTQYQLNKKSVQETLNSINSVLKERSKSLNDITSRKNTLQAEVASKEQSIADLDNQITEARLAEAKIAEQIEINEKKRDELYAQMEILIPQIQKESKKTDLQTIIEAKNLSQLIRRVYGLSSVQAELSKLDAKILEINKELDESKKQQEEIRKTLENTQFLIKSEKDGLQLLLDQTRGEESQYQSLVASLQAQQREQQAEISRLDREYQAEIDRQRIATEQARIAAERANSGSTGGSNGENGGSGGNSVPPIPTGSCRFEDGRTLPVRLSRPASGFISDNFGCPSVTGRSHDGYDIANSSGTSINAAYAGIVERKGFEGGGFGNYIMLRHNAQGVTFFTLYAHMQSQSFAPVGAFISQGSQIGLMGSTGWSTGPHLHFMIYSDSYLSTGSLGCTYGPTKCFNPGKYISF